MKSKSTLHRRLKQFFLNYLNYLIFITMVVFAINGAYAQTYSSDLHVISGQYLVKPIIAVAANGPSHKDPLGYFTDGAKEIGNSGLTLIDVNFNTAALFGYESTETVAYDQDTVNFWCNEFSKEFEYEYCEPNVVWELSKTPSDAQYSKLWGMEKINAPAAWDLTTGDKGIIVAITDTGIDYTHPDLTANMWKNPDEIPYNGIDDDNNGYVDDIYGIDTANDDADPMDDNGHGTHCAGTVGAAANNAIGVAGVAWNVQLMALKFISKSGGGSTSDAIAQINYAIKNGAKVISASWGGYFFSQALYNAIKKAENAGVLFIAAAGNTYGRSDNDIRSHYPSGFQLANVIAVASTDAQDKLSSFSNYGKKTVHIAAPGSDIYSTIPGGGYKAYSGTSMATPHVAGLSALLYAYNPEANYTWVKGRVLDGDELDSLKGKLITGKRINALKALSGSSGTNPTPAPSNDIIDVTNFSTSDGKQRLRKGGDFVVNVESTSNKAQALSFSIVFSGPYLAEDVTCSLGEYNVNSQALDLRGTFVPSRLVKYSKKAKIIVAASSGKTDSVKKRFKMKRIKNSSRTRRSRKLSLNSQSQACTKIANSLYTE